MSERFDHTLDIDWQPEELARQSFVSGMRHYVLAELSQFMKKTYDKEVRPKHEGRGGKTPETGPEVHRLMRGQSMFQFYSSMRNNAQGLVWRSVLPGIERQAETLAKRAKDASGAESTLNLDPNFNVPDNITRLDVHHMPGCYHTEYMEDDVSMGALYEQGLSVFFMGYLGRDNDDVGRSVAEFLKARYPDFAPRQMLDIGCTVGGDTLPWLDVYPDLELHAIDPCAPVLRYAYGRAQSMGKTVHFHQMDGTDLKFPDESFDLVWSAQVLHEMPQSMVSDCLRECYRVLRPGGLMLHMELPPNKDVDAYEQFYIDWDAYYNNEPWYKQLRDQDPKEIVAAAGFSEDRYVQFVIPSLINSGRETLFGAARQGATSVEGNVGKLEAGVQWFTFGAWK